MIAIGSSLGNRLWRVLRACIVAGGVAACAVAVRPACGQGVLDQLREDVRAADKEESRSSDSDHPHHHDHGNSSHDYDDGCDSFGYVWLSFEAVTSPFWLPHAALGDNFSVSRSFARFPYDEAPGYMTLDGGKHWSARFSADYATEFNDLDFIGGRLLVDTASRWGIDTEMRYLQEHLPRGARDSLWLGDCNLTFRFAQNERMQWRTGLGFNWLDDPLRTDYGFNFTYGFDLFPRKPWVVSAEIDWGTLGHAGLFHFRGTVGAIFNRFEAYTGYEYYDFDHVQTNALIGGVRIWF